MLTKGAIGNLINRYRAVLKKCHLINTFGSLAVAGMLTLGAVGTAFAGGGESDVTRGLALADGTSHSISSSTFTAVVDSTRPDKGAGGIVVNGAGTKATIEKTATVTAKSDTGQGKVYGISSTGAANNHASITFKNPVGITTTSNSTNWHIGAYAYDADLTFDGKATITMTDTGTGGDTSVRGLALEADPTLDHTSSATFNNGGSITINSNNKSALGMFVSGGTSTNVKGDFTVTATSDNSNVHGIHAQYGGTVKSEKDANVDVKVNAANGNAYGIRLAEYADGPGHAELESKMTVLANGEEAYGIHATAGSTAVLGSTEKLVDVTAIGKASDAAGIVANGAGTKVTVNGNAVVYASSEQGRSYGISSTGKSAQEGEHASIVFAKDVEITTTNLGKDWNIGAYAYDADLTFDGKATITMTDTGAGGDTSVRGLALEADPKVHLSSATFKNGADIKITSGSKTAQGVFVSGGTATNEAGKFEVNVTADNTRAEGIRVQNSGSFTSVGDTKVIVKAGVDTNGVILGGDSKADGIVLATYSTGSGSTVLGNLDVDVTGAAARGIALEDSAEFSVSGDTSIKVTSSTGEAMGIYSNSVNGGTFGDTTINVTGDTGRTYGINVRTKSDTAAANPKLTFGKTVITVANGADNTQYLEGVHVDYSDIEFASLDLTVTDNATGTSTGTDVRGVNLQGDIGYDQAHATFNGDTSIKLTTVARNGYGLIASSGTSASMAGNLDIDVSTKGDGSATGILSRYGGAVTSAAGTTVDVFAKAENGDAKALHLVGFGSANKPGTASLLGDVKLTAEGKNAVHGAALYDGAEATLGSSGSTVTISATTSAATDKGFASGLVANGAGTKAEVNGTASISAKNTGTAGRVYGISSTGVADNRASITFNDDVSITTASSSNDWHIGAYAYDADLTFNKTVDISMTDTGADDGKSVRGLALESDPNHVSKATLRNGGSITIASTNKSVRGMFVSGGVSTSLAGDLDVNVTSAAKSATGLHVQHNGTLTTEAGTSINVVAKGDTAYALSLVEYPAGSKGNGSASFNGDVTLEAQGAKAENSHAVYGTGSITNSGNFTVKSGLLSGFTGSYTQTKGTTAIGTDSGFFGGIVKITGGMLTVGDVDTSEASGPTVAIGAPVTLGAVTDLTVTSGGVSATGIGSKVEFGEGSMLIVDVEKLGGKAAFTGTGDNGGQEFHASDKSKLHILNAKAGENIVIAENFASDKEEYTASNVTFSNPLIDASQMQTDSKDGHVELSSLGVKNPTEVYGDVDAGNALVEVTQTGGSGIGGEMLEGFLESGSRDATALNEVSSAAVTAGVQNTALRLADAASNTVLDHMSLAQHDGTHAIHSDGVDFWATPMYGNLYTSGMAASGSSVRGQFGGLALGADLEAGHFLGGQFRLGAAIHGGGGQSEAKGTACSVQNDYDFGGVNLYAGWNSGAFNLIGSVGYAFGNHEVEMGVPFASLGTAKADVDSTAFTADLRAEYQLKTDWVDVLPHVGVRYTALRTDGYDLKTGAGVLNSVDRITQNIVQFPIGVTLSKDFAFADWNVKPMVDVSFIPAVGDKDVETKVRFSGVNAVDSFDSRVMDSSSWAATMGVQAEKGDFTLGLSYGVQASSHETDQNIQLKLGWKF